MSTVPTPFTPNLSFTELDPRRWLDEDEVKMYDALVCPDLTHTISVEVLLKEHRDDSGNKLPWRKRKDPKTPEQEARQRVASDLLEDRHSILQSRNMTIMLRRLARERALRAGWVPPAKVSPVASAPDAGVPA